MGFGRASDPDGHLYDDLMLGDGETAARELTTRIRKFVCKRYPDLAPDADLITLEIFERICERIETFAWKSSFSTWVGGIAVNVLKEWVKAKNRAPESEEFFPDLKAEGGDPAILALERAEHEMNQSLVEEALSTLTEHQRQVFLLKHQSAKRITSEQIGKLIGISAGAVRSALTDAHAKVECWRKKKSAEQTHD